MKGMDGVFSHSVGSMLALVYFGETFLPSILLVRVHSFWALLTVLCLKFLFSVKICDFCTSISENFK